MKEKRKGRIPTKWNIILKYLAKNNLAVGDVAKILGVSKMQVHRIVDDPESIHLGRLRIFASLLDLTLYEFIYLLERNKGNLNNEDKELLSEKLGFIKNYPK